MSDVTVAPDASPAPAAEVPVETNQTSTPTPVGSQVPDRPPSRREAIQRAFERHDKARGEVKAADAKPGHNNPPEATDKEKSKEGTKHERPKVDPEKPTIDLRKRPADQPKEPQPRAEHGHFAARQEESAANPGQVRSEQGNHPEGQQQTTEQQRAAWNQPLQRMSQAAKADWAKAPESVRADVHRLHNEFSRAYQQYRGDHEAMNAIRPFHQMAQQQGTTLQKALQNYTAMEQKLRGDVVGGLDVIIDNLNLRDHAGKKLTLRDVAWHIVNQTPEQQQLLQSRNAVMAQSHQLQQANQRIAQLEKAQQQVQYASAFHQTRGAVDNFAATHPRLDELGDLIEAEVKHGYDLETAYKRAELLRPTAAQTRTATAAQTRSTTAQTRTPDRSISGAPGGTSNGTGRSNKPVGRREAIASAIKRVNASL